MLQRITSHDWRSVDFSENQLSPVKSKKKVCLVFCTVPNRRTGRKISSFLVKEKLAACVNFISGVHSFFRWKGKLEKTSEHLLIIKTVSSCLDKLENRIKQLHPYEVPEIIAFPISRGNQEYLDWVQTSCLPD